MEQQSLPVSTEPGATTPQSPQAVPKQPPEARASANDKLWERYSDSVAALVTDADNLGRLRLLIEVIAWHLSRVVTAYGAIAAGHLLERLGYFTYLRAEREQAQAEAEEAKKAGRGLN